MTPSYDAELNLLYVGTSVTSPAPKYMLDGNDKQYLYHNSTLALDPAITGITVATTERIWGESGLTMTRELGDVTRRTAAIKHLTVVTSTTVEKVDGGVAHLRGGTTLGPFDAIVLSTGAMTDEVPDGVISVGDCVAPRGIWAATLDAAKAARAL